MDDVALALTKSNWSLGMLAIYIDLAPVVYLYSLTDKIVNLPLVYLLSTILAGLAYLRSS